MKNKFIAAIIVTIAAIFSFTTTVYFGNNLLPNSTAEIICDGISIVLVIISFYLYRK